MNQEEYHRLGPAVREYVDGLARALSQANEDNVRLKRRVSNQRRELRRLCRAQAALRWAQVLLLAGERLGMARPIEPTPSPVVSPSSSNAMRQDP